jgi:D-alanyl-lipoteichoic acid acyltransferase DltB (MBOAT superfamily)
VSNVVEQSSSRAARRGLLVAAVVGHIGLLALFKYYDFFLDEAHSVLAKLGVHHTFGALGLVLPVGISFYTFQALGYVISVYRRDLPAERDLLTFAVFLAWFPLTVAGPIERGSTLLPQLRRRREAPDAEGIGSALVLILTGLFKKVVIADGVARYVNTVYAAPAGYRWSSLATATIGFAIQVYGDFSGYTDMARGSSRLLGVELRRNFEQPYLSRDIRELWTRWHTSLSSWFVDFVGRPIGAVGRGPRRAAVAVLVIFALIGLWHGPAGHYVVWGALNGALVVIWRLWIPAPAGRHPMRVRLREAPAIAATFLLFCLGVVFFRSDDVATAMTVLGHLLSFHAGQTGPSGGAFVAVALLLTLAIDLDDRARRIRTIEGLRIRAALGAVPRRDEAVDESGVTRWTLLRSLAVAGMVLGVVVFSGGAPTPFIYRQF